MVDLTEWDARRWFGVAAFVMMIVSLLMTAYLVLQHLASFTKPRQQRRILRIIFMIPVGTLTGGGGGGGGEEGEEGEEGRGGVGCT